MKKGDHNTVCGIQSPFSWDPQKKTPKISEAAPLFHTNYPFGSHLDSFIRPLGAVGYLDVVLRSVPFQVIQPGIPKKDLSEQALCGVLKLQFLWED